MAAEIANFVHAQATCVGSGINTYHQRVGFVGAIETLGVGSVRLHFLEPVGSSTEGSWWHQWFVSSNVGYCFATFDVTAGAYLQCEFRDEDGAAIDPGRYNVLVTRMPQTESPPDP